MCGRNFSELFGGQCNKFTIILGSGFHKQFIGPDSILSSWELLLKQLSPNLNLTGDYHIDFEKIIESEKSPLEDSGKTEKRLLKRVKELLQDEQKRVLRECEKCYPTWLFDPEYVSDVISLNFDEVPELILKKKKGVKLGGFTNKSSFNIGSKESYSYLATRHKIIDFGSAGQINFWHPHGVHDNTQSIILGLQKYSHALKTSIRLRNHHMKLKKKDQHDFTWYQAILNNPVLIIGAGVSSIEIDLWFALTSKNRTNKDSLPIFQMRECECKNDVQHQWFKPLFKGFSFDEQWKELRKLFTSN